MANGINESGNCQCQEKKLSTGGENIADNVMDNPKTVQEVDNSDSFLYAISFLLPIIGIISGSILLTTDNKKKIGRDCVLFSLAGVLMAGLIIIIIKVI